MMKHVALAGLLLASACTSEWQTAERARLNNAIIGDPAVREFVYAARPLPSRATRGAVVAYYPNQVTEHAIVKSMTAFCRGYGASPVRANRAPLPAETDGPNGEVISLNAVRVDCS